MQLNYTETSKWRNEYKMNGHEDATHRKVLRCINKILYVSGDGISELYSIILWTFPTV